MVLTFVYSNNKETSESFAPGDTRIISYSSTYCEGLTMSGDATLFLLGSKPPLSTRPVNNLTASAPFFIEANSSSYLKYHLYTGSKLDMNYCLYDPSPVVSFFLIKGSDNFNRWEDDGLSSHSKVNFSIDNPCSGGNKTLLYNFTSTDYYYFVFDNLSPQTYAHMEVYLMLLRTEYILNGSTEIVDFCSGGDFEYCTVSVPYRSHYTALLIVDNDPSQDDLYADWSCDPRVALYVLMVVIPFFFVVFILVLTCVLYICYVRRRRAGYSTLPATHSQPSVNSKIPSAPAPANVNDGAPPSSHGSAYLAIFVT